MSLLDKAKKLPWRKCKKGKKVKKDNIDLALEWLDGSISMSQYKGALKVKSHASVKHDFMKSMRQGYGEVYRIVRLK